MDNEINNLKNEDINVAERKYLKISSHSKTKAFISALILIFVFLLILTLRNLLIFSFNTKNDPAIQDKRILGHLPYQETVEENLIEIQPNILVHKDMYRSLLEMKADAERDNIYLVFLSGYRSIKLQKEIFYSLKSLRNQKAIERARVSAPPGYSEHSTGFAIDIGDAFYRETDFEVEFENTDAFKWLKRNAAKYHFIMSFDKNQNSVDYEPWHWRYEGSIEALKIFEAANRKVLK